jgi:hypothetical protein
MGSQKDFISGANFAIWCNVSLTAAAMVACAPQIRTLFLKRFRQFKPQREAAPTSLVTTQETQEGNSATALAEIEPSVVSRSEKPRTPPPVPNGTHASERRGSERRSKSTPLVLSNKFLRGDGKVGVGDMRLEQQNGHSDEQNIV